MEKKSYIFYASFYEAIVALSGELRLEIYDAVNRYALFGELTELSPIANAIFTLIRPQLDANTLRYENGKKGGRPTGGKVTNQNQTETETKPNNNQTETETKPNNNQNESNRKPNVNGNVNENVNENNNENVLLGSTAQQSSVESNPNQTEQFSEKDFISFMQIECPNIVFANKTFTKTRRERLNNIITEHGKNNTARAFKFASENPNINGEKDFHATFDWCLKNFNSLWLDYCEHTAREQEQGARAREQEQKTAAQVYTTPTEYKPIDATNCVPMPENVKQSLEKLLNKKFV